MFKSADLSRYLISHVQRDFWFKVLYFNVLKIEMYCLNKILCDIYFTLMMGAFIWACSISHYKGSNFRMYFNINIQ